MPVMSGPAVDSSIQPQRILFFRSLSFSIGLGLSLLVFAPLALLTFPLPYLWRYRFISQWAHFNLWWLQKTCHLTYEIDGLENVPAKPVIVLSKHQSAWETLALQKIFYPQVWVLKRELLWIPLFGWGLALLKPIAINRRSKRQAMKRVIAEGRKRLRDGCWVVIFPEGTRVAPGKKVRYRIGGAILAEQVSCPVVPVAHNSGDYWPRKSFIKYPGTIRLVIGPPIDSINRSAAEINRLAEEWIEGTVERIRAAP